MIDSNTAAHKSSHEAKLALVAAEKAECQAKEMVKRVDEEKQEFYTAPLALVAKEHAATKALGVRVRERLGKLEKRLEALVIENQELLNARAQQVLL